MEGNKETGNRKFKKWRMNRKPQIKNEKKRQERKMGDKYGQKNKPKER